MWTDAGYWFVVIADTPDAAGNGLLIYRLEPTGPFLLCKSITSLQGASEVTSAADLTFQRWHNTQSDNDRLFWGASTDGFNFNGWEISGDSGGWQEQVFDLTNVPTLGDLTGQPMVWIMISFISDS